MLKVCVLGLARSGTTAIYYLLQKILSDQFADGVDYVYEPFLWDRSTFNMEYTRITDEFRHPDSISRDGIQCHKSLPLYITVPDGYLNNSYVNSLFSPEAGKPAILTKCIRANGRLRLLAAIDESIKFVVIVRNPIDMINSVINKFSLFGVEYHSDDFPRFVSDVNAIFGQSLSAAKFTDEFVKARLFWKYMNLFLFESVATIKDRVFKISHEQYVENPKAIIRKLLRFLGLRFKSDYCAIASRNVGPITTKPAISNLQLREIVDDLKTYRNLLKKNGLNYSLKMMKRIETKYLKYFHEQSNGFE